MFWLYGYTIITNTPVCGRYIIMPTDNPRVAAYLPPQTAYWVSLRGQPQSENQTTIFAAS